MFGRGDVRLTPADRLLEQPREPGPPMTGEVLGIHQPEALTFSRPVRAEANTTGQAQTSGKGPMRETDRTTAGGADARHEDLILRFERAWQTGPQPALDDYLGADPAPDLLVELVHIDLEFRLKAGSPARAAD